jgi:hypothetical protein
VRVLAVHCRVPTMFCSFVRVGVGSIQDALVEIKQWTSLNRSVIIRVRRAECSTGGGG